MFKVKLFARFQRRERIGDEALEKAVRDAEQGLVEADLGGGLIKQRVPRAGKGKRGGYRTIIAYRQGNLAVFLLGFAKSDLANIEPDELEVLKGQARQILNLNTRQFAAAIEEQELIEIDYGDES